MDDKEIDKQIDKEIDNESQTHIFESSSFDGPIESSLNETTEAEPVEHYEADAKPSESQAPIDSYSCEYDEEIDYVEKQLLEHHDDNLHQDKEDKDKEDKKDDTEPEREEKPKIKLSLKQLKIVATWKYCTEDENCLICNRDLMMPAQIQSDNKTEPAKNLSEDKEISNVVVGECNHGYHELCFNNQLIRNGVDITIPAELKKQTCPYCYEPWIPISTGIKTYKSTV